MVARLLAKNTEITRDTERRSCEILTKHASSHKVHLWQNHSKVHSEQISKLVKVVLFFSSNRFPALFRYARHSPSIRSPIVSTFSAPPYESGRICITFRRVKIRIGLVAQLVDGRVENREVPGSSLEVRLRGADERMQLGRISGVAGYPRARLVGRQREGMRSRSEQWLDALRAAVWPLGPI